MTTNFTPGPWSNTPGQDTIWANDGDTKIATIADLPWVETPSGRRASDWMTEQANARLIAAAPSLYDSSQAVLEWARTPGHHGCNPYSLPFVREAEIALAQAEGRAPENWAQRITSNTPSKV